MAEHRTLHEALAALAHKWETAHSSPPVDPSRTSMRHARALLELLDQFPPNWQDVKWDLDATSALALAVEAEGLDAETLTELRESVAADQWHGPGRETVRALLKTLAAEKAAREEAEAREGNERVQAGWEKARADKAEQEREARHRMHLMEVKWRKAAEARVAELKAEVQRLRDGIDAVDALLADEGEYADVIGPERWFTRIGKPNGLYFDVEARLNRGRPEGAASEVLSIVLAHVRALLAPQVQDGGEDHG